MVQHAQLHPHKCEGPNIHRNTSHCTAHKLWWRVCDNIKHKRHHHLLHNRLVRRCLGHLQRPKHAAAPQEGHRNGPYADCIPLSCHFWGGGGGVWFWFWLAPGPWSLAPVCLCTPDLRHGNAERTAGTFRARPRASSLRPPALCAAHLGHWSSALHAWRSLLAVDLLTHRWRRAELWWPTGGTPSLAMPPARAHGLLVRCPVMCALSFLGYARA